MKNPLVQEIRGELRRLKISSDTVAARVVRNRSDLVELIDVETNRFPAAEVLRRLAAVPTGTDLEFALGSLSDLNPV